jgi:ABC-type dipeptide/oligopeptide/nickel transport system ATPase component
MVERVNVMYRGEIVETARSTHLRQPATRLHASLLDAVPRLDVSETLVS